METICCGTVKSDCGLLKEIIEKVLDISDNVRVLRDPTRGGLATTLNEFAKQSKKSIMLYEDDINRVLSSNKLQRIFVLLKHYFLPFSQPLNPPLLPFLHPQYPFYLSFGLS